MSRVILKLVLCDRCPDAVTEAEAEARGWKAASGGDMCPRCFLRAQQELRAIEKDAL